MGFDMRRLILALAFALSASAALAQNVSTVTITNGVPTAGSGTVSTLDNLIGTAGTPKANVLSVQGITGGFALPVSGTFWQSTQPISAASLPLPTGGATSANQTTANSSLSTIATNSGAPIPAQTPSATTGIGAVSVDPCNYATKVNLAISQNTTPANQLIAASGSTKIYVCSLSLVAAGATTASIVTGTGSNCGTSQTAVIGSITPANSLSLAANAILNLGSGIGTVAVTPASGALCLALGAAQYLAGNLTYVQQ